MVKQIDFYFDVVCPYAYIASTQIANIEKETKTTVTWCPVLLGGLYELSEAPQGQKSATTVMAPAKREYFRRETVFQVGRYNVNINGPQKYPIQTLLPMRFLTYIKDNNLRKSFAHALYRSFWVTNDKLNDASVLARVILAHLSTIPLNQLTEELKSIKTVNDVLNIVENDENIKTQLRENTENGFKKFSMFGVPTFVINNNPKLVFFGVDRIPFLKAACNSRNNTVLSPPTDIIKDVKDKIYRMSRTELDRVRENNTIEFYFDFASPWAFLGYTRLKEFVPFASNIVLKPVLLGAIFRAVGTANTPMAAASPTKRKYMINDISRWVEAVGTRQVMNSNFPIRTILALRVFIVDNRTIDCIFKAAWQQDVNISDENTLCKLLNKNGFNGKEIIGETKNDKIKNVLKDNTSFAISKGLFGVPAYVVNGDYKNFVWGQEKMDFVKEMCFGWKPPTRVSIFDKSSAKL